MTKENDFVTVTIPQYMGYFLGENLRKEIQKHCSRFLAYLQGSYAVSLPRKTNISESPLLSRFAFSFNEYGILKMLGLWAQSVRNYQWEIGTVICKF